MQGDSEMPLLQSRPERWSVDKVLRMDLEKYERSKMFFEVKLTGFAIGCDIGGEERTQSRLPFLIS